ncbi:hypothetical protein SAMN04488074_108152 [Lentzea albidocapillata subsp. violacea]|uniref:Uncharacterized protein n=1 Tax=Lentzea albidocapillata subsp. violacea TaxID=128104 RepID=A0A1G9GB19_9PSEU|nr:hypothetical protein [Lentzea albidocapillata]SDK97924.1 hypothetical protein SAMN04488074_108152 [Lentzea albidocapillata subsp. violacea]
MSRSSGFRWSQLDHGRFFLGMEELTYFGVGDAGLESLVLGIMPADVHDPRNIGTTEE